MQNIDDNITTSTFTKPKHLDFPYVFRCTSLGGV